MKKIITLCLFAFALILGTQSVTAQNKIEVNKEASIQAENLRKKLKFNSNQTDLVYNAYKEYGSAHARLANSNRITKEAVEKLKKRLVGKMETILDEEQFEKYKVYFKEQE